MAALSPQRFAAKLSRMAAKQVPFATSKAINDTAKQFQQSQTKHMLGEFIERNKLFIRRAVKIKPFATKQRPSATVQIEPPGGARTADILGKFEEGGTKRARDGGHIAIPFAVRRTRYAKISKAKRPRAFNFRKVGNAIIGDKRTFIIPDVGIFQRVGRRGRSSIKLLYFFERTVRIPADLMFHAIARKVVKRRFAQNFKRAFQDALKTGR